MKGRILSMLLTLVCGLFFSCTSNPNKKNSSKTTGLNFIPKNTVVDTSIIAIIPFQQGRILFDSSYMSTSLSIEDLKVIERLLSQCINDYNSKLSNYNKASWYISNSSYRQYIAAINNKQEKIVWINCMCDVHGGDWKKSIILVDDGGSCYFHLEVNLTQKKYYNLSVNGLG